VIQWVAGVDGCPGGWIVVLAATSGAQEQPLRVATQLCPRFEAVLALPQRPVAIAVDIPIGLLERPAPGGRMCDRDARQLLGRPRASSVFSPPTRPGLTARSFAQVRVRNGAGMSKEAFNILPKIREVDALMTPKLQDLVLEAHPELAFCRLAGRPMRYNKKTPQGRRERVVLLRRLFAQSFPDPARVRLTHGLRQVAVDDVLDACALALVAAHRLRGEARRVPDGPPRRDAKGLRMEIWY
jgi:predicted RNase H-like nuclease